MIRKSRGRQERAMGECGQNVVCVFETVMMKLVLVVYNHCIPLLFYVYVYGCFPACMSAHLMCALPAEARKGHQIPSTVNQTPVLWRIIKYS